MTSSHQRVNRLWPVIVAGLVFPAHGESAPDKDRDAIAAIQELGGSVRTVSRKSQELRVDFHLRGRKLTDQGLAHIAGLKDIAALNLRDTRITSQGLIHLRRLARLRTLHLERTKVGDAGAASLAELKNLEYLNLYATDISDKTLERLTGLKKLRRLYVWQTRVTDVGVARLARELPDLKIVRGVDLAKLPTYESVTAKQPEPKIAIKWIVASNVSDTPNSGGGGVNTEVLFENRSGRRVKLFWVSFGGQLKQYGTLEPRATRRQNSYSRHIWLITDEDDNALGYFVVAAELSRAVIPRTGS